MGQTYAVPLAETHADRGRLIKTVDVVSRPQKYENGISCEVYQGSTVVHIFRVVYERDVHRHLNYEEFDYILSVNGKGDEYVLQPDCYLPNKFLVCSKGSVYHIKRTKKT